MTGGHDLWAMGLGVLLYPESFLMMGGHKEQGHEVLPHSPCSQPGLPGKVMAGTGRMSVAVAIYFCRGFYGQLPAPWCRVWVQERGVGQGRSGQKVWEGVWVEDVKNSFGVLVSYEDLFLFQLREQEGVPCQQLSPNYESSWEGTWE